MNYWSENAENVMSKLGTSLRGLSSRQAAERLAKYGPNEIIGAEKNKLVRMFLEGFKGPLMLILFAAALISFAIGHRVDAYVISVIIALNGSISFIQQYKTDRAIEALKRMSAPMAYVIRDGVQKSIASRDIVLGDIIVLSEGSLVPAGARIIHEDDLHVDESMLTGESKPVDKCAQKIGKTELTCEKANMVLMGTLVTRGTAKAVVVATGMGTEMGKISELMRGTKKEETPLQQRMKVLGKKIGLIVIFVMTIMFMVGLIRKIELVEMLLTSISLAVSAIPEALPAIVTLSLTLGIQRMVRKKSLVKKLPIVETLGSATVICSDKTGTITENRMSVEKVYAGGKLVEITQRLNSDHLKALKIGMLCNDSVVTPNGIVGDPTENAMFDSAMKHGVEIDGYDRVAEVSFSSERKMMTVVYERKGRKGLKAYMKGAPEIIMERCTRYREGGKYHKMTDAKKQEMVDMLHDLNGKALRVLGVAIKENVSRGFTEKSEHGFIFVGLIAMWDPPREGVAEAIRHCNNAGIKVIMITGDHQITATAIAERVGLLQGRKFMTGAELEMISDDELGRVVGECGVFARVSPQHKLRIVQALQENGEIVGMTGDGVNDAPAMKKSDIGIAMGLKGTDVAKEASDMIIQDDNFATIVEAVREGRVMYDNIRKSIVYLVACNAGEVLSVFTAMVSGLPMIFIPVQILWMNLLTDSLPALSFSTLPPENDVMDRNPTPKGEGALNSRAIGSIAFIGLLMSLMTLLAFYWGLSEFPEKAQTIAFATLVFCQMAVVTSVKSKRLIAQENFAENKWVWIAIASSLVLQVFAVEHPFMQGLFQTVSLTGLDWVRVLMLGGVIFGTLETWKLLAQRTGGKGLQVF